MEKVAAVLKRLSTTLEADVLLDQVVGVLRECDGDELYNALLELLGFDILDNGVLTDLAALKSEVLRIQSDNSAAANASTVQSAPAAPAVFPTQLQKYYSTPLLDMQFLDYMPSRADQKALLPVSTLPPCLRAVFDFEFFNPLQSAVFDAAYNHMANLLVSAPTSSGKTNVALLCVMQMVAQMVQQAGLNINYISIYQLNGVISATNDLCVYLTPLKALASEITQKFKTQLKMLGFKVLECTGDENPPQEMIDAANLLILTPEKFDIITRKSQNSQLFIRQKLLIIDEIHLLGTRGRGYVLESIVCRTKTAIEALQSFVRFVGISATIPNYQDVGRFLECQKEGIFVFGEEYRPVPMTQFLVGVKNVRMDDLLPQNQEKNYDVESYRQHSLHLEQVMQALEGVYSDYSEKRTQAGQQKIRQREIEKENCRKSRKTDKPDKALAKYVDVEQLYDDLCAKIALVNEQNQQSTMIFVHSRRKSVELAKVIANMLPLCDFDQYIIKSVKSCEHGDLAFCMSRGVAFHNAQIDKQHKRVVEDYYRKGEILVVVCTATLAWGVNLPAQTVVIRGTNVFSDNGMTDLDILDVKQIFGRAGRPQFMYNAELGRGIILTAYEKLPYYIRWLKNETQIESHVGPRLTDILNAEIVLGNICTVGQATGYMKWSFYAVRQINYADMVVQALRQLQESHLVHSSQQIVKDDNLLVIPTELGKICSYFYIPFDSLTGFVQAVRQCSMASGLSHSQLLDLVSYVPEFYQFRPRQDEYQELTQMSGTFFEQVTEKIMEQLETKRISNYKINQLLSAGLKKESLAVMSTESQPDEAGFKVNTLLQAFVAQYEPKTASLVADQRMIVRSAPRIAQAFMEVLLTMKRAPEMMRMHDLAVSFAYQCWYFVASPLLPIVLQPVGETIMQRQSFQVSYSVAPRRGSAKYITMYVISAFHKHFPVQDFCDYEHLHGLHFDDVRDVLGKDCANYIITCIKYVPQLYIDAIAIPVSNSVLRIQVFGTPVFKYVKEIHGYAVDFQIIIARRDNGHILNAQTVTVTQESMQKPINIVTLVRIEKWQNAQVDNQEYKNTQYLQTLQDDGTGEDFPLLKVTCFPRMWCGGKSVVQEKDIETAKIVLQEGQNIQYPRISKQSLQFQSRKAQYTPLPKVKPLSVKALHWKEAEALFPFDYFNPLQSVMFNTLYYNADNVFIGAPTSSGKTVAAELAVLQLLKINPHLKAIYIAPIKALVKERVIDWQRKFSAVGARVVEVTGDLIPHVSQLASAHIIVTTPEKWDAMSRQWREKQFLKLIGLIILDEVHLIGTSRGAVLESIVARYLAILKETSLKIRFVALSTPSTNIRDVAIWLKVPYHNIFNFDNQARPVKLDLHIQGYIGERYCARMDLMNRPVYSAIKQYSPTLPVLVFVYSRKQTRKTAFSLINFAINDPYAPYCFLKYPNDDLAAGIQDKDAQHCIKFGVGIHHSGMQASDRNIIEQLYLSMRITIFVCTATLAAGVNIPAYMTILKGCEYFDGRLGQYIDFDIVDVQQMAGRAGRPQYIQYRFKQQIKEYFGEDVLLFMERNRSLDKLYQFDKDYIKQCLPPSVKSPDALLSQLETLNRQIPQAISIIMCRQSAKEFYKTFFDSPFPFESSLFNQSLGNPLAVVLDKYSTKLTSKFPDFLCAEVSSENTPYIKLRNWLYSTFFFLRARRNPMLYGIDMDGILNEMDASDLSEYYQDFALYSPNDEITKHKKAELSDFFTCLQIYRLLDDCLDMLVDAQLLQRRGNGKAAVYSQTALGRCQSVYYMSYGTILRMVRSSPATSVYLVMQLLACADEFETLPVRCPEPAEMVEFQKAHGIPPFSDEALVGTGFHKAYFALYARFNAISDFPSPEYALDSRTCFASAPRLLAALINVKALQSQDETAVLAAQIAQHMNGASKCQYGRVHARIRLVEAKKELQIEWEFSFSGFPDSVEVDKRVSPLSVCCFSRGAFKRLSGGKGKIGFSVPLFGARTVTAYCCSEDVVLGVRFDKSERELTREWQDVRSTEVQSEELGAVGFSREAPKLRAAAPFEHEITIEDPV